MTATATSTAAGKKNQAKHRNLMWSSLRRLTAPARQEQSPEVPTSLGLLAAGWIAGSAVHYTILPHCLTQSSLSITMLSLLQVIMTGAIALYSPHSAKSLPTPMHSLMARPNIIIAGLALAFAVALTNAGVAFGSLSGTRLIKSLEPVLVTVVQLCVHRESAAVDATTHDPAWLFLLSGAIAVMLGSSSVVMTPYASIAALLSTLSVVLRNVLVKKELESGSASCTPANIQAAISIVAGGMFALLTCLRVLIGSEVRADVDDFIERLPAIGLACVAFAMYQLAGILVLRRVSATRQSAIKSTHSSLVTMWTLFIQGSHASILLEEVTPTAVWCTTVTAIALDARVSGIRANNLPAQDGKDADSRQHSTRGKLTWRILLGVCWATLIYQSAIAVVTM